MDKLFVDLRVKLFMKNIITYGLSILLMASLVHVDYHADVEQDGYNICKIGCEEQKHHSISHQCQKCLNNNQRLYFLTENEFSFNQNSTIYYSKIDIVYLESIIFDLRTRPPPSSI